MATRLFDAPATISDLHPIAGAWQRRGPWSRGRTRETYSAIFICEAGGRSVRRKVTIAKTIIHQEEAALWAISEALGRR
jgi:hypothetical protein